VKCNSLLITLPGAPDSWKAATTKTAKGEPAFPQVDNPGGWSEFTFCPTFATTKKGDMYEGHTLPTGAHPVPVESDGGGRTMGGRKFNYNEWKGSNVENMFHSDSTQDGDQLPDSRKGKLDGKLLSTMGLTQDRMNMVDALFFLQLLLPICDPKKSGIANDPRKPFYSDVEIFSQKYAHDLGLVSAYGHNFKSLNLDELVHFDGVLVRDGVRGGSNGAVYRRWEPGAD
jgi:hypothetical protein